MEKTEPSLVPEWLKNGGSSTGGSSMPYSDDRTTSRFTRNKSFVNSNGHEFGRSSSDMTTSSYFRRNSSSNGSGNPRPYSSFGRNQRDKEWEKDTYDSRDKGKVGMGNRRYRDYSDPVPVPVANNYSSTIERDGLRRSQSMISGKRTDTWQKRPATELNSVSGNNNSGLHIRSNLVREVKKETFEKDFPSLGSDEKTIVPEVGRIPSPGLTSAIQSLPIATSVAIGGEKWTSALAEVPVSVVSNGTALLSVQPAAPSNTASVVSDTTTGLNMAKAVVQGSSRAQTSPQLSVGSQRLEELAIKQSRQLIPVTPALPKALVVNTSDKHKSKLGQHHHHSVSSSLPVTHSPRVGTANGDVSKAMNTGKLHVLKPVLKNGVTPVLKDTPSPTNGGKVDSGSALTRAVPNKLVERKPVLTGLEKRPTSQAQSRNDFFNQVRKKSNINSSSGPDSFTGNSSSTPDKITEAEAVLAPNSPQAYDTLSSESSSGDHMSEQRDEMTCNGHDGHKQDGALNEVSNHQQDGALNEVSNHQQDGALNEVSNGKSCAVADSIPPPEGEEAVFLRSLGWEENDNEDVLTEEEISQFFECINLNPSLQLPEVMKSKFSSWLGSDLGGMQSVSSVGVGSSGTKLES